MFVWATKLLHSRCPGSSYTGYSTARAEIEITTVRTATAEKPDHARELILTHSTGDFVTWSTISVVIPWKRFVPESELVSGRAPDHSRQWIRIYRLLEYALRSLAGSLDLFIE